MHTRFQEIMTGQARLAGEERPRPALLDAAADVPGLLLPWAAVEAALAGHVRIGGWADDPGAAGTLRIPPVTARRIRYRVARFGPEPWSPTEGDIVFATGEVLMTPTTLPGGAGSAEGRIRWDLAAGHDGPPLYTFARWAWEREGLPGAQVVPVPAAACHGTPRYGDRELILTGAPGAIARSYGHGNPQRWAWLHADLGGDVCEVVAATPARPRASKLAPLPFARLRAGGWDWPPGDPLVPAVRCIARIDLPTWQGKRRWELDGTAHAEAGVRE